MTERGIDIHKPDHSFTFGSTPLRTWDILISRVGMEKGTVVFEVGCGTGMGCFFVARRLQSTVVGIEYSDAFMRRAEWVHRKVRGKKPFFVHGDAREIDYSDADVVYLFSTTFTPELYRDLSLRLQETLVDGAVVLSVSEKMNPADAFEVIDQFDVPYYFGFCTVFVHRFHKKTIQNLQQESSMSFSDILIQKTERLR